MAYSDFNAPDREAYIRSQYVLATGKVIENNVLTFYLAVWVHDVNSPKAVILDIWENKHFTDHA